MKMKDFQAICMGVPFTRLLKGLVVLAIFISLYSCKTQKSIIKEPLKEYGTDYLLDRLADSELNFDWLSAKINVNYIEEKSETSFKGQVRIRKDSIIWITFSPALGIEVARLKITQDSIFFMNRMDKVFFKGDYDFVNRYLETQIDFDMLQALIIGNDFQFYEKTTFRAAVENQEYKLSTTSRRKLKRYLEETVEEKPVLIQNIWLDPSSFKISRIDIKEYGKEHKKLEARYGEHIQIQDQKFPSYLEVGVTGDKNILIRIRFSKISLNSPLSFPFTIPNKYERIR